MAREPLLFHSLHIFLPCVVLSHLLRTDHAVHLLVGLRVLLFDENLRVEKNLEEEDQDALLGEQSLRVLPNLDHVVQNADHCLLKLYARGRGASLLKHTHQQF